MNCSLPSLFLILLLVKVQCDFLVFLLCFSLIRILFPMYATYRIISFFVCSYKWVACGWFIFLYRFAFVFICNVVVGRSSVGGRGKSGSNAFFSFPRQNFRAKKKNSSLRGRKIGTFGNVYWRGRRARRRRGDKGLNYLGFYGCSEWFHTNQTISNNGCPDRSVCLVYPCGVYEFAICLCVFFGLWQGCTWS